MTATNVLEIQLKVSGASQANQAIQVLAGQFGGLKHVLEELLTPLLTLGTGTGFALLAHQGLEFADATGKMAKAVGVSSSEMAGLAYAAQRDDVALDSLKVGLKTFSEYLSKSGQGSQNLKEALIEQAKLFSQLPAGADRTALAVERFGRAGVGLVPFLSEGPKRMQELIDRGEQLSGVNNTLALRADEFNNSLKDLKLASQSFAAALLTPLLPALTKFIETLSEGLVTLREWTKESQAFKVGAEAVGVSIVTLTTFAAGSKIIGGFGSLFGGIKSLSDFGAALRLIPSLLYGIASAIGVVGFALLGIAATLTVIIERFRLWKAEQAEAASGEQLTEANKRLAASIRSVIDAREKEGTLSAKAAENLRTFVDVAAQHPGSADARLRQISQSLISQNPSTPVPIQWTEESLIAANKAIDKERELLNIQKQKTDLEQKYASDAVYTDNVFHQLADIQKEESLIGRERLNIQDAFTQKAIDKQKRDELNLVTEKQLFELEKQRQQILEANFQHQLTSVELRRQTITDRISEVDLVRGITEEERQRARNELLRQEVLLLQQKQDLIQKGIIEGRISPEQGGAQISALQSQQAGALSQIQPTSFTGNIKFSVEDMIRSWGTAAQQVARIFTDTIGTAIQSVSRGIAGLITGTKTWAQAVQQIGTNILEQVITAIVEMGIKWVVTHLIMGAALSAFHALANALGWSSAAQVIAQESAKAPVLAVNASTSSVSSYGAAAIVGIAALVAALGIGIAAALGAFAEGGRPPVGQLALVGEKGPELFLPDTSSSILEKRRITNFLGPTSTQTATQSSSTQSTSDHSALTIRDSKTSELKPGEVSILGAGGPELFIPKQAGVIIPNHEVSSFISSHKAFADGGRPTIGSPALVGERGIELFAPDSPSASIIDRHFDSFKSVAANGGAGGSGGQGGRGGDGASAAPSVNIHAGLVLPEHAENWLRSKSGHAFLLNWNKQNRHLFT